MKSFLNSISILFCLVVLVCCKSRKPLEPERITETRFVKEIVRDTVIEVKADSTYYDAWIECVNGKPVLREPQKVNQPQSKTKETGKALQKPKVNLDENGKLTVECYKEVESIKARLTNKYESLLREHRKPVYIEKPFTWYQKALMWIGGISLALCAIGLVLKIKK